MSYEVLDSLQKEKYYSYEATQVFYENEHGGIGGYTNKKEIFLYREDEEICSNPIQLASKYRELRNNHGKAHLRNVKCPCGSGIQFKKCCLSKYSRAYQAIEETQKPFLQNYRIADCIAEMPIYEFWYNEN